MKELVQLAETVRTELKLGYDIESVKYLEEFIERQKERFSAEEAKGLINSCGAFLGQCVIVNYGGQWTRDAGGAIAVAFDAKNMVYPFAKVSKQFANGLEDSVYSFYTVIPVAFRLNDKPKKKWWQF
jgi:hypothetical protein